MSTKKVKKAGQLFESWAFGKINYLLFSAALILILVLSVVAGCAGNPGRLTMIWNAFGVRIDQIIDFLRGAASDLMGIKSSVVVIKAWLGSSAASPQGSANLPRVARFRLAGCARTLLGAHYRSTPATRPHNRCST